jgi:hypothetical protein
MGVWSLNVKRVQNSSKCSNVQAVQRVQNVQCFKEFNGSKSSRVQSSKLN